MTTKAISISYNPKSGRFVLAAPIWMNELVRAIPNRRFDTKTKTWTAPATRLNVNYLSDNLGDASWSSSALAKLAEVKSSVGKIIAPALPWPAHYKFKTEPFRTQRLALSKAFGRPSFAFYKGMGCITGDAVVQASRNKNSKKMTLRSLYEAYNRMPDDRWKIRSLVDGEFRQHRMLTIINKGRADIVELTLEDGKQLRMTPDHPVMNESGEWIQPKDLKSGDVILVNGRHPHKDSEFKKYAKWPKGFIDKNGYRRVYCPKHPRSNLAGSIYEHILVMENELGRFVTEGEHIHHIGAKDDNRIEMLELSSRSDHLKKHGKEYRANLDGGVSPVSKGKVCFVPKKAVVVSVKPAGNEEVFDVAMENPYNNFVANGIIVHNTGKSKTFIDLACASRMHPLIESALIICPFGVRKNWLREVEIHSPFPVDAYLLDSADPKDFERWLAKPHDFKWLVVGVESLGISKKAYEMVIQYVLRYPNAIMCVDESHKIKTHNAVRSIRCATIARSVKIRVAMTGTPIAKGVMDLYSQFEYLDPDIIGAGDFYSFRNRYAEMGGHENKEIVGYKNIDELMEIINPFIYQVRKEEALPDLPPKMRTKRYVTLNAAQAKHYKSMLKDKIVISGDRSLTVKNALGKALRLQQIVGGFVPFEEMDKLTDRKIVVVEPIAGSNPKVDDLLEFCDDIDGSLIVWCAFRAEIDVVVAALRAKYGHDDVVEVHGGISEAERDINVNELFQKKRATKLVANAATGGTGLTMTAAEYEYFFSNTFNSIDREQAEDRAHRSGQKKTVLIVDCIAQIEGPGGRLSDCIDATVIASLEAKKDLSEYIKGEIERLAAQGAKDLSAIFGS